jgi:Ca-activated chloride channel homolog
MNSISRIAITFDNPLFLFLLIPITLLVLWPFFKLKKQHRYNRYRITSLVLRFSTLLFAVLLLSGINIGSERFTHREDVILLVDVSDSTELSMERMNNKIKSIIDESNGEYNIGIITFANGSIYNVRLTSNTDNLFERYLNSTSKPDSSATNIGLALSYARSQLPNPERGRIILLTDGIETDGSAVITVQEIRNSGTRVDSIYFTPNMHYNEVQINNVVLPELVNLGEMIPIEIEVQSTVAGTGVLSVYDNTELIYQETVPINGFAQTVVINHAFNTGGLHELYFVIESDFDTVQENNSYYAFVDIDASSNILIVDGTGNESQLLVDILSDTHAVSVVETHNLPTTITALQVYDQVILMNVANAQLPESFVLLLDIYVNSLGGGLLTIGGDNAYKEDDMSGSSLENMLPVLSSTSARPLAVMFVLDASGSMADMIGTSGKTRFDLAKEGAIESVMALDERDYFGLVSFSSVANVSIPMTPVTQRDNIIDAINALETNSGTQYRAGLELAAAALIAMSNHYMKHIIFITDGDATDPRAGYTQVVEGLADHNITMSGIAIYRHDFFTAHIVRELTEVANGRYYYVQDATTLPDIMLTESTVSGIEYINEGLFVPDIRSFTSAVVNINDLPELGGYYGTLLKENATMVLSSDEGLPVYASWQYGSGKVGSFTSDLNGHWSSNYFTDPQGVTLIRNIVSSLLPERALEAKIFDTVFLDNNLVTNVRITGDIEENHTVTARVTDPNGLTNTISIRTTTGNVFSGNFDTRSPGIYTVTITKRDSNNNIISESNEYHAFSYSKEYNVFADSNKGFDLVERVAEYGNGKLLFVGEGVFTDEAQFMYSNHDPRYLLLSLMILFFILDVFARKFKFLWPHEYIRNYRNLKRVS